MGSAGVWTDPDQKSDCLGDLRTYALETRSLLTHAAVAERAFYRWHHGRQTWWQATGAQSFNVLRHQLVSVQVNNNNVPSILPLGCRPTVALLHSCTTQVEQRATIIIMI